MELSAVGKSSIFSCRAALPAHQCEERHGRVIAKDGDCRCMRARPCINFDTNGTWAQWLLVPSIPRFAKPPGAIKVMGLDHIHP